MAEIQREVRDQVWILSLNRPPVNAINLALISALGEHLAQAAQAEWCRAVVLTGRGRIFSGGIDVKEVPAYDRATQQALLRAINRAVAGLYGLAKPTVAAINGHALGAGLVLALTCDFRLAAEGNYQLGLPEARVGIPFPAAPLVVIESELGPHDRTELALTGVPASPHDPLATRFLRAVMPPEQLLDEALALASSLAEVQIYGTVKAQIKATAMERLHAIVEHDAAPLLDSEA
jgi:enoyl-CoA hydratase